ncbi:MAG: hypothetical protein KGY75_06375 [Candidatus Cloacimonetes bacterium]|nr:hypothetical protein [Candidatus Cloacimonadota bacterium]
MEIAASIILQSNTSCEIILSNQLANNDSVKYNIIDFSLKPKVDISNNINITINYSEVPYNQFSSEYELYGTNITTEIGINSNTFLNITAAYKPSYIFGAEYEIYSAKTTADISISGKIEINIDEISDLEIKEDIVYYLEDYPSLIKIRVDIETDSTLNITYLSNNESIMVLDPELNLLTYLDDMEYFSWVRRWRRPDSFKLMMNRYKENADYLKVDNYLIKKTGDVLRGGRIRDRKIKVNEEGRSSEVWEIIGRGFGDAFNQRLALNSIDTGDGYDTKEAPAETVMKYYVDVNTVNPSDINRKIPNLRIEEDKGLGRTIKYKARFQKLSDILYDISQVTGLGWDIKFDLDNKEFIFQVLYAELKPEIKLSTDTNSVQKIKFTEDRLDSINTAIVAGQGEGSDRMIVKVTEDDL